MSLIRRSMFTNSISKIPSFDVEVSTLPEISVFLLYAAAQTCLLGHPDPCEDITNHIVNTFDGIVHALQSSPQEAQEGDVVEAADRQWLGIRLATLEYAEIPAGPLHNVLGIDKRNAVVQKQGLLAINCHSH